MTETAMIKYHSDTPLPVSGRPHIAMPLRELQPFGVIGTNTRRSTLRTNLINDQTLAEVPVPFDLAGSWPVRCELCAHALSAAAVLWRGQRFMDRTIH